MNSPVTIASDSMSSGDERMDRMTGDSCPASVGVAVITYRAVSLLPKCLPPLLASALRPKLLVVNSSSNDGTIELAEEMGAGVLIVPRHQFNHGSTREIARRVLGTDIVVMMTPDATPLRTDLLSNLVRPIVDGLASAAYARQIPRECADFFEAFPRHFNYPNRSELRTIDDAATLGPQTFFCSNVCAAWSNAALDSIGGFAPTLSLEDTIAVVKLLSAGHRIAYCADAVVEHSHDYGLAQEFKRQFDTGYVRAEHRHILLSHGADETRGAGYASDMLFRLFRQRPQAIPYALANIACKYFGYRLGFHGHGLPLWLKRRVSGQDFYWQNAPVRLTSAGAEPLVSQ
jgi:rhamnosyltransferase